MKTSFNNISKEEKQVILEMYGVSDIDKKKFPYQENDIIEVQFDNEPNEKNTFRIIEFKTTDNSEAFAEDNNGDEKEISFFRDYKNRGNILTIEDGSRFYRTSTMFKVLNIKRGNSSFVVNRLGELQKNV